MIGIRGVPQARIHITTKDKEVGNDFSIVHDRKSVRTMLSLIVCIDNFK